MNSVLNSSQEDTSYKLAKIMKENERLKKRLEDKKSPVKAKSPTPDLIIFPEGSGIDSEKEATTTPGSPAKSSGKDVDDVSEDLLSFAQKKKKIAQLLELQGQEKWSEGPSSVAERLLTQKDRVLTSYTLPMSGMVAQCLASANANIRDTRKDLLMDWDMSTSYDNLPKMGPKALKAGLAPRNNLTQKNVKKFYAVQNYPEHLEDTVRTPHIDRKATYSARVDSYDTLLALGFAEQAFGAVTVSMMKDNPSKEERQLASDSLLCGIRALTHSAELTTRILMNCTLACRDVELKSSGLNQDKRDDLRTLPIQLEKILPFEKEAKKIQIQETSPEERMCQAIKKLKENPFSNQGSGGGKSRPPFRGRGNRARGGRGRGHTNPTQESQPIRGKTFRGRGHRGFRSRPFSRASVSSSKPPSTSQ
jgi:hypothetical protein